MKILFLSRWFPYPANNGSKLRVYNLLRFLSQQHDVTLLSFADPSDGSPDAPEIYSLCKDVHIILWKEFDPRSLRARLGYLSLRPRSVVDTFSIEMAKKISQILNNEKYDLVIASQLPMAAYYPYFKRIPALFEEVELGLSSYQANSPLGFQARLRHRFTWLKFRFFLSRLLGSFNACTVASQQERELFTHSFPRYGGVTQVIPNCLNADDYENIKLEPNPNSLIFSGSFRYHANYEAMLWFIRDIYPLILEQLPDTHLYITGDHANLPLPPADNVILTGHVDNIKTLIASSWVSIAPLKSGGGTRLKIIEAMAIGTPVVATSKGAEGLEVQNGEHLVIADAPDEFANCVIKILRDNEMRHRLARNGRRLVKEKYNWSGVFPRFLQLAENVAASDGHFQG